MHIKNKHLYLSYQIKTTNKMKTLSNETKTKTAIQMVIMDAIEKGHTNTSELIDYMKSVVFEKAVKNYILLLNQ